jgi:hypothetical protein
MKPGRAAEPFEQIGRQPFPDSATVIGIALLAYSLSSSLHEGLGHGGACLLTGGKPQLLTAVNFDCNIDNRLIEAGGTLVNLAVGALAWALLQMSVLKSPPPRYFVWLLMTANLLSGGGYFLYSGFTDLGDWAAVIHGLQPAWFWHVLLVLVGAASYYFFVFLSARELQSFIGSGEDRWERAKRLTLIPYFTGGILVCFAGLFNPVGLILVGISAAAATFGGTSGLVWMPQLLRGRMFRDAEAARIYRSYGWIAAGVVAAAILIAVLGPGIRFRS